MTDLQRHLRAPARGQPSLFSKRDFAKLHMGKHTARFGSRGRERRDKRVPSRFGLHPCAGAGIPPHPHIPTEPQGSLPATPVPGSTGDPGTARPSSRTGTAMDGDRARRARGNRKAPARLGEFTGAQKAASAYSYFHYD